MNPKSSDQFLGRLLFFLLCIYFLLATTQKVNLAAVDLGRHITNGHILIDFFSQAFKSILSTNFYSYTHPSFPFVNHHWGTGIVFYVIERLAGFEGLSIFYSLLSFATFLIFFHLTFSNFNNQSNPQFPWLKTGVIALFLLPLTVSRTEIRPEGFSYFFAGVFYWILLNIKARRIPHRRVILLMPLLMVLWVNLHIYFFLGFFLMGAFLFDELYRAWRTQKQSMTGYQRFVTPEIKSISLALAGCMIASLINPQGIQLALFPLLIFKNYGYLIAENQSVPFFMKRTDVQILGLPSMLLLLGVLFILIAKMLYSDLLNWKLTRSVQTEQTANHGHLSFLCKEHTAELLIMTFMTLLAMGAVRNLSLAGFFAMPFIAIFGSVSGIWSQSYLAWMGLTFMAFLSQSIYLSRAFDSIANNFGIGLMPNSESAAEFIKRTHLKGPIFNNYDIGGYLIYYLFPENRVFVDNRPEAYPDEFFKQTYVPMQETEKKWKLELDRFGFNTIIFYWHDLTPWGQNFLGARNRDSDWVQIYRDPYVIIWVRRNGKNEDIIQRINKAPEFHLF